MGQYLDPYVGYRGFVRFLEFPAGRGGLDLWYGVQLPTISTFAIAELLTMNNIKLFGTTIQENINNGMWNYGAALSLIMLLLIGITGLFSNESSDSANEGGLI